MKTRMSKLALAICAMTMVGTSVAATDTANLAVDASVVNACAIGPGALSFGAMGLPVVAGAGTVGAGSNHDANTGATISIACTNGAAATITAGVGINDAGAVRKMNSGTDLLTYTLYTDGTYGTVLDIAGVASIPYTGTGAATTTTAIYGRITAAQLAAAVKGTYADTVAMLITYTP